MKSYKFGKLFSQFIFAIVIMVYGNIYLLAQVALAPTATTESAVGISASGATVQGTVNANGSSTTVFFEYGLSEEYGQTMPGIPSPISGSSDTEVIANLSLLDPDTTYHYRVGATNAGGTTYGDDMTFMTLSASDFPPTLTTGSAIVIGSNGATVSGTVNANGLSVSVFFEYGISEEYGYSVLALPNLVGGSSDTPVIANFFLLNKNTTYHYRIGATYAGCTTYGSDMTFTTLSTSGPAPVVITEDASDIGANFATLNAQVTTFDVSTVVSFEWGTDLSYGNIISADQSPVTSSTSVPVTALLSIIAPDRTYHYRVVAFNINGAAYGEDKIFVLGSGGVAPTVITEAATEIGSISATLNGKVNANGMNAMVIFEYGLDSNYGHSISADQNPVVGNSVTNVSVNHSGFMPNTTYHYRVSATNTVGTDIGDDMTFTTLPLPPNATTNQASLVGTTSATLNGIVNANGDSTTVTFEYGLDTNYGTTVTADQSPVTGSADLAVSKAISGLSSGVTYHYRVVAENLGGTTYGADMVFSAGVSAPTVTTESATNIDTTSATLNGIVNANNGSTIVTFEYGETFGYGRTVMADQSPIVGSTDMAVSFTVINLNPDTIYHYRVVGENVTGTTLGLDKTFTTNVTGSPKVITANVTNITAVSATCGGNVTSEGGASVTARGVCWSTNPNPTITDDFTVDGTGGGSFTSSISGLNELTTYYVRAYATNMYSTVYGNEFQFITPAANLPTVQTAIVTDITMVSATSGGDVTDEGDAPVTARGVCWSTNPNPTIADNFTSDGTGGGSFTSNLTGLTANTIYYLRAYATNLYGTAYGNPLIFTTSTTNTPVVTTTSVINITADSATSGGNVINEGDASVTNRGVCWSMTPHPTIANNRSSDGSGAGVFTSNLINLTENTTYYVRAYATNSFGTSYGNELKFTTGSGEVDVIITAPVQGEVVSGTVTIAASASVSSSDMKSANTPHSLSVSKVKFYINDSFLAADTTEPYETQWDTTTIIDGNYTIKAVAYDQDENSAWDEITVTVSNTPSEMVLNRTHFNFGSIYQVSNTGDAAKGGSVSTNPQTLLINNSGGGNLKWSVSKKEDWLACFPCSGEGAGIVTISVDSTGLAVGSYSTIIEVADLNTSVKKDLPVNLIIYSQGGTSPPFGFIESPENNSIVRNSIPVTGWALDDIEVSQVKIFRAPISSEGSGMVYIGDAVLVDGARPDVEETYPSYPMNYQAGWGYMLLTHFLPNMGNGTYTLYAKAVDAEGNYYTLGSRTITCDNVNAVKPFGAIDTPEQGGIASGKSYVNFGWALTPQPNTIPIDGSTMMVWIDGVPLGNPVYNKYRSDIAELFPGYNNSSGAGGHFYLDTTTFTNGVHTISWSVKDNAGNLDGIGSRYFTIINTNTSTHQENQSLSTGVSINILSLLAESSKQLKEMGSVTIKELDYLALSVVDDNQSVVGGFLEVNGHLKPLPIGSNLDTVNGIFSWNPGPGFKGAYHLIFEIKTTDGKFLRKPVIIAIEK